MNEKRLKRELREYLSRQEFAPILKEVPDKQTDCVWALKLMCIVHYEVDQDSLYDELKKRSQLMCQLMNFDYCLFKYYHYQTLNKTLNCRLKCQYCSLVADYSCVLTHMAITHNAHVGLKKCAYCDPRNPTDLSKHTVAEFKQCQEEYYKKHSITTKKDLMETFLIENFYKCMGRIAKKLKVVVLRNRWYGGVAQNQIEQLANKHGHDFPQLSVAFSANSKIIDDQAFFQYFELVAKKLGINLESSEENLLSHNVTNISASYTVSILNNSSISSNNKK